MKGDVLVCTGLSDETTVEDLERRRCYLCKRKDGSSQIAFDVLNRELVITDLELFEVERKISDVTLIFELCKECLVLMGDKRVTLVGVQGNSRISNRTTH